MRRLLLAAVTPLLGACGAPIAQPTVVAVGFSAEPSDPMPGKVAVSTGGDVWSPPVAVAPEWLTSVTRQGDRFVAIGLSGGLYDSDPTGTLWSRRQLHTSWLDAIVFPDAAPGVGFASGIDAFWRTDDGGATWVPHPPPLHYFEDFAFRDGTTGVGVEGYLVPAAGYAWRTTDGGLSWSGVATTPTGLRAVARPSAARDEYWAVGDLGVVIASTDGGVSWVDESGPARVEPLSDLTGVSFAGDDQGWMVGSHGAARRYRGTTYPLGQRWTHGSAGDWVLQGVWARSGDEAYVCGYRTFSSRGAILRTSDGGASWQTLMRNDGIFWYGIAGR